MSGRLTVVGLGPGGADLLTLGARDALAVERPRFVRTRRHPAAGELPELAGATSFDEVYDGAADLEEVYRTICARLVDAAAHHGDVLYAVPGSPAVAERTVELLRAASGVVVEEVASLSFVDLAWVRLGVDPLARGVRLVDGHRFAVEAAGATGPLLVGQCDRRDVLSEIKLSVEDPPSDGVVVLQRLGLPDESVRRLPWAELDRAVEPDHLTSLYVGELGAPVAGEVQRLVELVRALRVGCPWDREQTHRSLARYLTEESAEVLEAIDQLDPDDPDTVDHLAEELGDLMFQVVFHATIAAEEGWFDLAEVARGVHDKLYGRHPHVFGDVEVADAAEVAANWERIKTAERPGGTSVVDGVPITLPALARAAKLQKRLDGAVGGSPTSARGVPPAPRDDESAMGEALWRLVADCRAAGVDPEDALRRRVAAYERTARAAEGG